MRVTTTSTTRTAHPRTRTARTAAVAALALAGLVASAVPGAAEGSHRVRPGETASEIAAANGTTVQALAQANGLRDANRIVAGQVLVIPGPGGSAAPAAVVHVVAPGESLSVIARRYGTTIGAIVSANGIGDANLIRIGQRLTIPAGGAGGGSGGGGGGSAPSGTSYGAFGADGRTGVAGTHVVARGETLAAIARRYGITVADLAAANGIIPQNAVYAGARLRLDAGNRLPTDIVACPVPGARFMNDWGFPRSGGRAHEGTDMLAPRGTPVRAPVAGTVSYGTGAIGGKQFRLVGDDGTVYLGSHMDGFGAAGRVAPGDVIGYVGSSGNAAGGATHLHFEVHPDNGPAMNAYPLLRDTC